jgi:hypothetical protein
MLAMWGAAAQPEIGSTPRTTATVNQPYRYDDDGFPSIRGYDGGTFFFALEEHPPTMVVDNLTGELFWLPTDAGTFRVRLRPSDRVQPGIPHDFDITVSTGEAPDFTPPVRPVVTAGVPATLQLRADRGSLPRTWLLEAAPPGALLQPEVGSLSFSLPDAGVFTFRVSLTNEFGRAVHDVEVEASSAPLPSPTARLTATPAEARPGEVVTLDAAASESGTTPAGPLAFSFSLGDDSPTRYGLSPETRTAYRLPGVYQATVTVENSHLQSSTATARVTVKTDGGATPPSARIVASRRADGFGPSVVDFTCACEAGDAPIVSYQWDYGDAEQSNEPAPSHAYLVPGGYNVRLTVVDAAGLEARDTFYLPVWRDGRLKPPFARARARPVPVGDAPFEVELVAEFGDPDGIVVRREWSFPDRPTSLDKDPTLTLSKLGTLRARLTVYDNDGIASTDVVELKATRNGQLPPEIRSRPNATARVGEPWAYDEDGRAAAVNGPFRWVAGVVVDGARVSAPEGLSIDERTGAVSWTPTAAQVGAQEVALVVTNEAGEAVQRFVVTVEAAASGCGCDAAPGLLALVLLAWARRRGRLGRRAG